MARFTLRVALREFDDDPRANVKVAVTTSPARYPVPGVGILTGVDPVSTNSEGVADFNLAALPGLTYTVSVDGDPIGTLSGNQAEGSIVRLDQVTSVAPSPIAPVDAAALRAELSTSIAASAAALRAELQDLVDGITINVSTIEWDDITKKPSLFEPLDHTHMIEQVIGLQDSLDALQAGISSKASEAEMSALFTTMIGTAPAALDTLGELATRLQSEGDAVAALTSLVADLQTLVDSKADGDTLAAALAGKVNTSDLTLALSGKANTSHDHDARYYTKTQSDAKYALAGSTGGSGIVGSGSSGAPSMILGTNHVLPAGLDDDNSYPGWADRISIGPMPVERGFSFTSVSVSVSIAVAGSQIRLGIYKLASQTGDLQLVYDLGSIDASTAGAKTVEVPGGSLTPGLYFTACTASAGNVALAQKRILTPWGRSSNGLCTFLYGYAYGTAPYPATIAKGDLSDWIAYALRMTFGGTTLS